MIVEKTLYSQFQRISRRLCCLEDTLSAKIISSRPPITVLPRTRRWISPHRSFSHKIQPASEAVVPVELISATTDHGSREDSPVSGGNEEPAEFAPSTPWYLQVKQPFRVQNPLLDRQQIPELPSNPPTILQPMLEHISVNIGLDDLSVLDLRPLDPPPALGANLLMIIGTARSEKHLHISADRFCRWLRTEHKLSPYPDGLLGRGELKLKMRRKARRARIMSRVGAPDQGPADDGLRTGWICVNVGIVDDEGTTSAEHAAIEGYVGFGSQVDGTKLVVQMLTQEKREELDLERLWKQALARQERRTKRINTDLKGTDKVIQPEVASEELRLI